MEKSRASPEDLWYSLCTHQRHFYKPQMWCDSGKRSLPESLSFNTEQGTVSKGIILAATRSFCFPSEFLPRTNPSPLPPAFPLQIERNSSAHIPTSLQFAYLFVVKRFLILPRGCPLPVPGLMSCIYNPKLHQPLLAAANGCCPRAAPHGMGQPCRYPQFQK